MSIKDALWREIRYGLCGSSGALNGLVAPDHVKQDLRPTVSGSKSEDDYPWLIFRRVSRSEDNQVNYNRERIELEIIGLHASATKGDDLLETIENALLDHFSGKRQTWGKYDSSGNADPNGGLKLACSYVSTAEGYDETLQEKAHVLILFFTYVRG